MIDFHLHVRHYGRSPEETIAHITGLGCSSAVLLAVENIDRPPDMQHPTEEVLDLHRRYPSLVIPFCCVDPRAEDALNRIEEYATRGCKGFGELKVPLPVNDSRSQAIYRMCGGLGLPVLIHLEEYNFNTHVLWLEDMLSQFPDTTFIGHGQSFWAYVEESPEPVNGYPSGPVDKLGPTVRWLVEYPNLYGDLSAGSGLNALTRDEHFTREMLLSKVWHKLLWATDCPCRDGRGTGWAEGCFGRRSLEVIRRLSPSDEVTGAVLHGNAVRVLGLASDSKQA